MIERTKETMKSTIILMWLAILTISLFILVVVGTLAIAHHIHCWHHDDNINVQLIERICNHEKV